MIRSLSQHEIASMVEKETKVYFADVAVVVHIEPNAIKGKTN